MESTVTDFWRMIWEQQCKVIIMLTDLVENGVEKCTEYIPPSEVTDCRRLYGDFQVTLKKRETKEKYAISTLHLNVRNIKDRYELIKIMLSYVLLLLIFLLQDLCFGRWQFLNVTLCSTSSLNYSNVVYALVNRWIHRCRQVDHLKMQLLQVKIRGEANTKRDFYRIWRRTRSEKCIIFGICGRWTGCSRTVPG